MTRKLHTSLEPTEMMMGIIDYPDGIPVYGTSELTPEDMDFSVKISVAPSAESKNWRTEEKSFAEVLMKLLSHPVRKNKDGESYLQGNLTGSTRTAKSMQTIQMLVLDIDSGQPIEELRKSILEQNLFAIISSTFSYGATSSTISRDALMRKMDIDDQSEITTRTLRSYLKNVKRVHPSIVNTVEFDRIEQTERQGWHIFYNHAPISKFRVILPLAEEFRPGAKNTFEKDRDWWKKKYTGVAYLLGAEFDHSCVDMSRLFYSPGHKEGSPFHTEMIQGDFLDLANIEGMDARKIAESNPFIEAGLDFDQGVPIVTSWLKTWMRGKYKHFAATDFFVAYSEDRGRDGEKQTAACPYEEDHSAMPEGVTDMGFFCVDGDSAEKSFVASCSHNGCKSMGYTKLNFIDKVIQTFDLTEADLDDFIPMGIEEVESVEVQSDPDEPPVALEGEALLQYHINKLTMETIDEVDVILNTLLDFQFDNLKATVFLKQIAKNSGVLLGDVKKAYNKKISILNRNHADSMAEEDGRIEIPVTGDFAKQVTETIRGIKNRNKKNPSLFQAEGQFMRVGRDDRGRMIRTILNRDEVKVEIFKSVSFYQQTDNGRNVRSCPLDVLGHIYSMDKSELGLPYIKRVAKHPILGPDGSFTKKHGYDRDTQVYIDVDGTTIHEVPDVPTEQDLDNAYDLLFAPDGLLGDFPFKDEIDDDENEDCVPGESTKAHVLALFMLPFLRDFIDDPTPAFVINKPMPGAGSGLLANVFNIIINNQVCPTSAPPKSFNGSEELEKLITGKALSDPDSPLFFDNVERIDSTSLASAITSGYWSGRILGASKVVSFPIRWTWLFSGNNINPSDELARRMVPINIMPEEARPENRSNFFHTDLVGWTYDNRADLIWAIMVIIRHWVVNGMQSNATAKMGSFETWARVTGGILADAGIPGFLDNLSAWRDNSSTDVQEDSVAIESLIKDANTANGKIFSTAELFTAIYDDVQGKLDYELPIHGRDEMGLRKSFGQYMRRMKGKIFEVDGERYRLDVLPKVHNAITYRFKNLTNPVPYDDPRIDHMRKVANKKKMNDRLKGTD